MTNVKTFQVRDDGTHIPVMCVRVVPDPDEKDFRRAGFRDRPYFILTNLLTMETLYDPYKWPMPRAMYQTHQYIIERWAYIKSGDVIDIEFILGETTSPKEPEA